MHVQMTKLAGLNCFIARVMLHAAIICCFLYTQVYGLFRHGTRYPTIKHLSKWEKLQQKLLDRLSSDAALSDKAKNLRHWTNPLNQDVVSGKAEATELTKGGMKEQYCLARRLRERFPEVVGNTYSPLTCGLRSTQVSRTVKR